MIFKSTEFVKRLTICVSLLFVLLFSAIFISYSLDNNISETTSISDTISEQRYLAQRMALMANLIQNSSSPEKIAEYKKKFSLSVSGIYKNEFIIRKFYEAHEELQKSTHEYYNTKDRNGLTRLQRIKKTIALANEIDKYLKNTPSNSKLSNEIQAKIKELYKCVEYDALQIATGAIDEYKKYIENKNLENKFIKLLLIIIFFVAIFGVIAASFLPLHKKLHHSADVLKQERLIHATERKRLKLALEGTSTGIWDLDIKIGFFVWNNIMQEMLGINYDEDNYFEISDFYEMLHSDDLEAFKKAFNKHLENGFETKERFEIEARIKHKNGDYIWTHFLGQAMWNKENKPYRMIGSAEDISSRKEAEIEKNIFIQGIEACNIAFAIIDLTHPHRNFRYASKAFCDLTGHDPQSLSEKNLNIFTGPKTSMSDLDKIDYAISEGLTTQLKMQSYRVDGSDFWNKITLNPIRFNDENTNEYYITTFTDLTDSIEQEKQEILRQRNESLGTLAASVAHEINNLLMPMSMAKDILEDEIKEDCDPFAREQLDMIVDYANQAKEIVQGILTFSRKGSDDLKKMNLFEELNNSIQFIQSLLGAKTTLTLHTPKERDILDIEAMVNSTEMKQIFTNMCRNAEHAFDDKSGNIDITVTREVLSNTERTKLNVIAADFAVIQVTDNGTGIPKDHIEKIFEPLFTTKDIGAGTGLGLSVVHGIVRSWGGTILVDSVEGTGTTFSIYIPVDKSDDDFSDLMDLLDSDSE